MQSIIQISPFSLAMPARSPPFDLSMLVSIEMVFHPRYRLLDFIGGPSNDPFCELADTYLLAWAVDSKEERSANRSI